MIRGRTAFILYDCPPTRYGSAYKHHKPEHRETLGYILHDRTKLNESWHKEYQANGYPKTLRNYLSDIKKRYKEKIGQGWQKAADKNAIKEGIVVIDERTTMDDLKRLAKEIEKEFGWTVVQIHIHRDEGYRSNRSSEKLNLHAHLFIETPNRETGRTWRPRSKHTAGVKLQDITAQVLGMQRGEPKKKTGKEHLSAIDYKVKVQEENLIELEKQSVEEIENLRVEKKRLEKEIVQEGKALDDIIQEQEELNYQLAERYETVLNMLEEVDEQKEHLVEVSENAIGLIKKANSIDITQKDISEDVKTLLAIDEKTNEKLNIISDARDMGVTNEQDVRYLFDGKRLILPEGWKTKSGLETDSEISLQVKMYGGKNILVVIDKVRNAIKSVLSYLESLKSIWMGRILPKVQKSVETQFKWQKEDVEVNQSDILAEAEQILGKNWRGRYFEDEDNQQRRDRGMRR